MSWSSFSPPDGAWGCGAAVDPYTRPSDDPASPDPSGTGSPVRLPTIPEIAPPPGDAVALSRWVNAVSDSAQRQARIHVQCQLLAQQSGEQLDILLDERCPALARSGLVLPPAELLLSLLNYQCRVALVLVGPGNRLRAGTAESLAALPIRRCAVDSLSMLERLIGVQRSSLRMVDLANVDLWDSRARQHATALLADCPNVVEVQVAEGLPRGALGRDWIVEAPGSPGLLRHAVREDGLDAMDAACHAWEGTLFGTQVSFRRVAGDPGMIDLFQFATRLAVSQCRHEANGTWRGGEALAHRLRTVLFRAGDDPAVRRRVAETLLEERPDPSGDPAGACRLVDRLAADALKAGYVAGRTLTLGDDAMTRV